MSRNKLTAEALKSELWETLQGLRKKKIAPEQATAVASTAREIMRVVRTEIQIAQMLGGVPQNLLGVKTLKKLPEGR